MTDGPREPTLQAAVVTMVPQKPARRTRTRPAQNGGFSDNHPLSRERVIESQEYARIVGAFVRALTKRGLAGDIQALIALSDCRKQISEAMAETAVALRVEHNYSWGEVGLAFGVTRQAARQRWGQK